MSAQPYTLHIAETPEPRKFYMLTRPNDSLLRRMFTSREHAEVAREYHEIESPNIGPWEVVELVEVLP